MAVAIDVLWDMTPCILVSRYQHCESISCLRLQDILIPLRLSVPAKSFYLKYLKTVQKGYEARPANFKVQPSCLNVVRLVSCRRAPASKNQGSTGVVYVDQTAGC
jgi:hypothetical protein